MILKWFMASVMFVKCCRRSFAVVWPMKEESQYLTLTLLMPQNLTVMSIWQAWKIWFKLSLNPTDRNFDLLISLTNLSFDQISIFNLSIDQISDIISTHLIAVWDITVWKHHSYYFIHVTVRVVWVTLYNTIQCSHYFSLQGVAV